MPETRFDRFSDSDLRGISLDGCECNSCRHVHETGLTCDAFPRGIPSDILDGSIRHVKEYKGDKGIRYEPWPKK